MSLFLFCKQILSYSISYSTYCFYFYCTFEFLSKILDMSIDCTIVEVIIISDNIPHKCFTFDDAFHIPNEVFKYRKFSFCEFEFLSWKGCYMIFCIDLYISKNYCFSIFYLLLFIGTFCYGSDTSDKLPRGKWLCNIVISSEFKKSHFIIFTFSGREYDNWSFWYYSDFSANFDSILSRKIDVKDYKLRFFSSKIIKCHESIRTYSHCVTRLF